MSEHSADYDAPRSTADREELIDAIGRAGVIARLAVDGEQVSLGRSAVESIADHLLHAGYRRVIASAKGDPA